MKIVLLVEDNELVMNTHKRLLKAVPDDVLRTTTSFREAMDIIRGLLIAVPNVELMILSDHDADEGNGLDFLCEAKELLGVRLKAAILCTGGHEGLRLKAESAGFIFLAKPFTVQEFRDATRSHLEALLNG